MNRFALTLFPTTPIASEDEFSKHSSPLVSYVTNSPFFIHI